MSDLILRLTIDDCHNENDGGDHAALDILLECITSLVPMARDRDRDEESLSSFLKEVVYGTDWVMRATAPLC